MTGTLTKSKLLDFRERRNRLFEHSRPNIRPATKEDAVWIRLSEKMKGIDMTDEAFTELLDKTFSQYNEIVIIEDRNAKFGAKFGPIGIVAALGNGNLYEPHVEWFEWATDRNILRGAVAYFQKFRYRKIGTIVVHCLGDSARFFKRLKTYVPLHFVGKIPEGDSAGRGDDYIFYLMTRSKA